MPERESAASPLPPDDPRHGTANGYSHHRCRCSRCREAWRIYFRHSRPGVAVSALDRHEKYANARARGASPEAARRAAHRYSGPREGLE